MPTLMSKSFGQLSPKGATNDNLSGVLSEDTFDDFLKDLKHVKFDDEDYTFQFGRQSVADSFATGHTVDSGDTSLTSWSETEFNCENTRQIAEQFSAIDEYLYNGDRSNLPHHLLEECDDWNTYFPHLRLSGKGILDVEEDIQSTMERPPSVLLSSRSTGKGHGHFKLRDNLDELRISGKHIELITDPRKQPDIMFAQEGNFEEIIAIDFESDADSSSSTGKTQIHNLISSKASTPNPRLSFKNQIRSMLFDFVWKDVVDVVASAMDDMMKPKLNPLSQNTLHIPDAGQFRSRIVKFAESSQSSSSTISNEEFNYSQLERSLSNVSPTQSRATKPDSPFKTKSPLRKSLPRDKRIVSAYQKRSTGFQKKLKPIHSSYQQRRKSDGEANFNSPADESRAVSKLPPIEDPLPNLPNRKPGTRISSSYSFQYESPRGNNQADGSIDRARGVGSLLVPIRPPRNGSHTEPQSPTTQPDEIHLPQMRSPRHSNIGTGTNSGATKKPRENSSISRSFSRNMKTVPPSLLQPTTASRAKIKNSKSTSSSVNALNLSPVRGRRTPFQFRNL